MSAAVTVFIYGTLRDPEVQQALIGRTIDPTPAVLHGYHRHTDGAYPVALPDPDSHIDGATLQITPDELAHFDEYEGDGYIRVRVTLANGNAAWVYIGNPAIYAKT